MCTTKIHYHQGSLCVVNVLEEFISGQRIVVKTFNVQDSCLSSAQRGQEGNVCVRICYPQITGVFEYLSSGETNSENISCNE